MASIVFCVASLVAAIALSWVLFPLAALSPEELIASRTPIEAELLDDVAVPDFGDVPVIDMVLHYIDNPPLESAPGAAQVRFQGC